MAQSPLLGREPSAPMPNIPGTDEAALGPSDISDTGSDVQGASPLLRPDLLNLDNDGSGVDIIGSSDSDSTGTGEGLDATGRRVEEGSDIAPDRVISVEELEDLDKGGA
jgi:hypothetical protein